MTRNRDAPPQGRPENGRRRIHPQTSAELSGADAALCVLESPARRSALAFLIGHPESTRQDIIATLGTSPATLTRALGDLQSLGYVTATLGIDRTWPDRFSADGAAFVNDLNLLRDRYAELTAPADETRPNLR